MKATELRNKFVNFFKERGHTFVPSDNLIPKNDNTILFTNAGMNQFKDVFLEKGSRDYCRAVDYQKCMRVSGKHNDLEEVGRDHTHHTFFEMMGNWSFGDYYKEEAIAWAWEFLINTLKIPVESLWITIYKDDDESGDIWKKVTGLSGDRIVKFGDKENFWEMGATGPCGPCTEIHFDRGEKYSCSDKCTVNCECGRFVEIWNNVFIQYFRDETGTLNPLPKKHVDTGLGFERTLAIVNGEQSNYNTDLFQPIFRKLEEMSGVKYDEHSDIGIAFRVIADHIRALTFTITDGVLFSNDGQGYVIRKILRRAQRFGKKLGFEEPFLNKIVMTVVEIMKEAFPELPDKQSYVEELIIGEEERFIKTLRSGLEMLNIYIAEIKGNSKEVLNGSLAFKLYDTYGFPLEVTKDVCLEMDLNVDEEGFYHHMELQKNRARSAQSSKMSETSQDVFVEILKNFGPTIYEGEEKTELETNIIVILKDGKEVDSLRDKGIILFPVSPFYGESGGQVGDTGIVLEKGTVVADVVDTQRFEGKLILHQIIVRSGMSLNVGKNYSLKIDVERRCAIRKNHTGTHLLQAALRKVLGNHVTQAGSKVGPNFLRFDYTHHTHTEPNELMEIERMTNELILENTSLQVRMMPILEAKKLGAMALFDEKYDDTVRVINIGGKSIELCGGSHVLSTGEIGVLKIRSDSAIASGIRRIEATAGFAALDYFQKISQIMDSISGHLVCKHDDILDRIIKIEAESKSLKREIKLTKEKRLGSDVSSILDNAKEVNGVYLVTQEFDGQNPKSLLGLIDKLTSQRNDMLILFANRANDGKKVQLFLKVGEKLTDRYHAGKMIKEIGKTVGGGGGGKADMAQAGGTMPENIQDAFKKLEEIV
ncbi:alanine--tRNA ligase [bacterium]|nr:alanine--tRNA ligase [bacterium]